MDRARTDPITRVVLLGYMCSGKSTVGEALAERLGWGFVDFDLEIERREGSPVASIIEREGAEYFRRLEAALTHEMAGRRAVVLAPGGGWITQPELLTALGPGTFSVWLKVSPAETVRRLRSDPAPRPLKDHPDPIDPITEMIEEREPLFRRADRVLPADDVTPSEIAARLERDVRMASPTR